MKVGELIKELEKYPKDMYVVDMNYIEIEIVHEGTWTHTNYPYDIPDEQVVILN